MAVKSKQDAAFQGAGAGTAYIAAAVTNNQGLFQTMPPLMTDQAVASYWQKWSDIDTSRWDKLFPYELIIAEASTDSTGAVKYESKASFVMPIPPEQLQIQNPYAILLSKTLGGFVEEHNAEPFRMIMAAGSFGINPNRGSFTNNATPGIGGFFAGTVKAVNAVGQNTQTLFSTGLSPTSRDISNTADADIGTGYYQFKLMEAFLSSYVRLKTTPSGRNLRLVMAIYKDERAYVITPITLNVRRVADRPMKYSYEFQARAFSQIRSSDLQSTGALVIPTNPITTSPTVLSAIQTKLAQAHKTILSAISVVNAARADIQQVLDIARQSLLAVKLTVNAATAVVDLPRQVIQDFQFTVIDSWDNLKNSVVGKGGLFDTLNQYTASKQSAQLSSRSYVAPLSGKNVLNQTGVSIDPSVLDAVFSNPYTQANSDFLSAIPLDQLNIPVALQKKVDTEFNRVQEFTPADYAKMRDQVLESMVNITDSVGGSDATFSSTYSDNNPVVNRTPNLEDFSVLFAINDILDSLSQLAIQPRVTSNPTIDYVAGIASQAGVAFQKPVSKRGVPFPYDFNLERLAQLYLGDPDRWLEIAILNGLREPYVDEVGFDRYLIANGSLSTVSIADATNLEIGQAVWIQSNFVSREKRHILNVQEIAPGNVVLTLDGPANLDRYHLGAQAYIHAFLPDTVNSQMLIYIPSNIPVDDNSELAKVPGVDAFNDLLEVAGVDLLITLDNDLAVTPDGDCLLAQGLQAIAQTAKVALATPRGTLLRHPSFGLPIKLGMSVADLNITELSAACKDLFAGDPAFNGITSVAVKDVGPVLQIGMSVVVFGQDNPISINIQVQR